MSPRSLDELKAVIENLPSFDCEWEKGMAPREHEGVQYGYYIRRDDVLELFPAEDSSGGN